MPRAAPKTSVATLLDSLPWPTILVNGTGRVTHVNAEMRARGVRLQGRPDRRLLTVFPDYYNALEGERRWLLSQDADVVVASSDGPVRETLRLRRLGAGAFIVVVDQTRLHELEAGYAQNARLASMGFLLASIAHEISNPLSVISSAAQILQSKRGVSAEVRHKGIALVGDSARRMLLITRRLTGFSRVVHAARRRFAIDDVIDEASLQLRFDSLGESVDFDHQRAPDAIVLGHQDQLQQVFFNLFLNAAQAMKGRGTISVVTRRGPDGQVHVTVGDTGPGIDPRALGKIFEPFFTTKPAGEGLGLGLAISVEIVSEHGGSLTATAVGTDGAMFLVRLPLVAPGGKMKP
ncbi:MAG: ATP-binding protein [Betaproteobacteria bacterium]